ncbi:hypothetical protein IWW48_004214 [Coemansia sp. RSA 1200]|nr:hypothetical protein IWW48_004214 [Coemansia sp. RSA 1200]
MTSADEYSLLDSGRMSGRIDTIGFSHLNQKPVGSAPLGNEPDPKDPPSLDLLVEMIKEEIRQASILKQALDRIGLETESMSQRVTNLSIDSGLNVTATDDQAISKDPTSNVSRKHVQFTIPDDVRFRWLGIFQQPQDDQDNQDGGDDKSDSESDRKATGNSLPLSASADAKSNDNPGVALDADTVSAVSTASRDHPDGLHTHSTTGHCAQASADQGAMHESPDPASSVAMKRQKQQSGSAVEVPMPASNRPQRSTSLNQNGRSVQPAKNIRKVEELEPKPPAAPANRDITDSLDQIESESGSSIFAPFTTNSSVEAVYGGSRSDTRESLLAQGVPTSQQKKDNVATRPSGHLVSGGSSGVHTNGTIADQTNRIQEFQNPKPRAAQQQQQQQQQRQQTNIESESAPFLRLKRGEKRRVSPSFVKQQAGNSAFAQPTLATSKVTVSKRYSVSPPFDGSKVEGVVVAKAGDPAEKNVSKRLLPLSYARHSNLMLDRNPEQKSGMGRRRNSYDTPGFQPRGSSALPTHETSTFDPNRISPPHTKSQNQPSFGGGLFRRVTTSSAIHRKGLHGYRTQKSQDGISLDEQDSASIDSSTGSISNGAAGLIGGTRDFFKHRLRSRTNSNQPRNNSNQTSKSHFVFGRQNSTDSTGDNAPFLETIMSGKASDTFRERVRKRSDAEVKTRDTADATDGQQQSRQQNNKQHLTRLKTDKQHGQGHTGNVPQPPLTVRTLSGESQSSWLAVQPPSSAKSTSLGQSEISRDGHLSAADPLLHAYSHRKSHDDVLPSMSRPSQGTHGHRQRARASSSDGQPSQSFRTESSMRLTKGQLELLRLRPAKDGGQANESSTLGTRTKTPKNSNGSSKFEQQHAPAATNLFDGNKRADDTAEADSGHGIEDRGFRPPPMPQMPPPPPPSLLSPLSPPDTAVSGRSSNTISKAGDTDSIDYHMRRLKSDRKGRRLSFMTTISNILGRKD